MSFNKDEIKEWKRDGWSFRRKMVKGNQYITRRKGQVEKGLGRYTEGNWRLIQTTSIELTEHESRKKEEVLIEALLEIIRSHHMSLNCEYIVDGFCQHWRYKEKPGFFNTVDNWSGEEYYKRVVVGDFSFWVFRAANFYCKNCPAYKQEKTYSHI